MKIQLQNPAIPLGIIEMTKNGKIIVSLSWSGSIFLGYTSNISLYDDQYFGTDLSIDSYSNSEPRSSIHNLSLLLGSNEISQSLSANHL